MATVTLKNIGAANLQGALDLTIGDREFVVLTGPAGSGGSVIVRLIAGLSDISSGEIAFDNRRVDDLPPHSREVAFVSHDYALYPVLTVYQNLAIALQRRKFAEGEIKKRISAVADALCLQGKLEAVPKSLSNEDQRLLGLARAMVRQPPVYLFDDPFAGLDPAAASRGRAEIAKLHQRASATIIYATSDPAEALALGTRTIILDAGSIRQDAGAESVYAEPADLFVAKFFGDPPMNLVQGTLKPDRDGVIFSEAGEGTISIRLPGSGFAGPAVLGFRPEAVEIASSADHGHSSKTGFRALVDRAEPGGGATDLYLRTGAHDLVCRSRRWEGTGGRRLQFEIDLAKTHLFDPDSGRRLTAQT
ncbi:MAG TPA: ABC transporter ATP-binding protein [Chthoniobacterales bacterium]|jgi:ABC-type sugar transport system ATPase subunit